MPFVVSTRLVQRDVFLSIHMDGKLRDLAFRTGKSKNELIRLMIIVGLRRKGRLDKTMQLSRALQRKERKRIDRLYQKELREVYKRR